MITGRRSTYRAREAVQTNRATSKRGYIGIYHHMSAKHLHRYVHEFSFRHNTAKAGMMPFIDMTMSRMIGKRLTYKDLIHA